MYRRLAQATAIAPLAIRTLAAPLLLVALLGSAPLPAALAPVHASPGDTAAQDKAARRDQLSVRNKRDGSIQLLSGIVRSNQLDQVVLEVAGKETKLDSGLVVRINWGDVPPSFKDGRLYFNRGQYGDAAAQFRLASGDASARDVVKASARLWAAQSLLRWGAADPLHFLEAGEESTKFLAEYPNNRDVPEARVVQARAKWMAGQAAEAGRLYKALYAEWKPEGPTPGYRRELCLEAGLSAARALLQVKPPDTLGARELYSSLDKAAGAALAALEPTDPARARLLRLQDEAILGDGFAELAAGNAARAAAFFEGKLGGAGPRSDTLVHGASFGLAQAKLAQGNLREAQLMLAKVSGLEHYDRDRAAAAQVALAETTLKLADPDATPQARNWLEAVHKSFGDTLAAIQAREMLKKL